MADPYLKWGFLRTGGNHYLFWTTTQPDFTFCCKRALAWIFFSVYWFRIEDLKCWRETCNTPWYFQAPLLFTTNNFVPLLYTGDFPSFQALRQICLDASRETSSAELSLNLERTASEKGFVISDNQGEGNCMFFALSEQLNLVKGIDMSHSQLRQTVVNYLRDNPTQVGKVLAVTFSNNYIVVWLSWQYSLNYLKLSPVKAIIALTKLRTEVLTVRHSYLMACRKGTIYQDLTALNWFFMFPETKSWKDYILDSRELLDQFVEGQRVLRFIDRKRRQQMPAYFHYLHPACG